MNVEDKQGCDGAISTNLEVTVVLKQRAHMEIWPVDEHVAYIMEKKAILKKRCAEETKSIPAIYDEEASAASTEQSTSDHFPAFQPDRNSVYNLQLKSISFVINRQARTSSNWQKYCEEIEICQVKCWACSKEYQRCEGAISINLDVTIVQNHRSHMKSCPVDEHVAYIMEKKAILKKRCAEETKSIPAIYDEEAAAASTEQSTSGHCPAFKRFRNAMYNPHLTCILKRCKQAQLCLVANCCVGMSCAFEGRAYKFQHAGIPVKCRGCSKDKQGCEGAISTSLDSHAYTQKLAYGSPPGIRAATNFTERRRAEGTKSIPENYDEEITAPSADPSTSVQFPVFRQVNNVQHLHWLKRCLRRLVNHFDQELPPEFNSWYSGVAFFLSESV
ncbi:hypothetical protein T11_17405 [Trichinella zimbabwensis]|uniref:FLYWCH-type domain-containing protein n=1 Tax=Trichinella zimbabwensis TaxID=268475 RepID=A0A0V1GNZ4_9BILA|nr:hypothetical protein T11_444 [Trichinella zimbabwensis]KRZ01819.1 hypothetical protein T11_17405 [Trichinella zimbabwensis]